jgi:hypothetical protein
MMGMGFSMGIQILWWLCPGKQSDPFATNGAYAASMAGDGGYSSGGSPPE